MAGSVLEKIFGTKYRVLAFFIERPGGEFYAREIARALDLAPMAVHRDLVALQKDGVLTSKEERGKRFFRLKACHLNRQLKVLANLDSGLIHELVKEPTVQSVDAMALYGSRASGESSEGSDWDFIVIGDVNKLKLNRMISQLEQKYQCEISVIHYLDADWFKALERNDPAFYREVLKNHVVLKGELP